MLWSLSVAFAVPLLLPPTEDASGWAEPAAMAGFELDVEKSASWAQLEAGDGTWTLVVRDELGDERRIEIAEPATQADREELVFLASSLLTPSDPGPVADAPAPVPQPAPVPPPPARATPDVVTLPEPEPEPDLAALEWTARLDAGIGLGHGEAPRPVLAPAAELRRGRFGVRVEGLLQPWSLNRDHDLRVHRASLGLMPTWHASDALTVSLGAGPGFGVWRRTDLAVTLFVPTASARVGWSAGRLGVYGRVDHDLGRVEIGPTGTSEVVRPLSFGAGISLTP